MRTLAYIRELIRPMYVWGRCGTKCIVRLPLHTNKVTAGHIRQRHVRPKLLNSNLAKSCSSSAPIVVIEPFWKCVQLQKWYCLSLCNICKTVGLLSNKLWAAECSRELSWRCVSGGYHTSLLHGAPCPEGWRWNRLAPNYNNNSWNINGHKH